MEEANREGSLSDLKERFLTILVFVAYVAVKWFLSNFFNESAI